MSCVILIEPTRAISDRSGLDHGVLVEEKVEGRRKDVPDRLQKAGPYWPEASIFSAFPPPPAFIPPSLNPHTSTVFRLMDRPPLPPPPGGQWTQCSYSPFQTLFYSTACIVPLLKPSS